MALVKHLLLLMGLCLPLNALASRQGRHFDRVIFVIFENKGYAETIKQPFFRSLAQQGANFTNFTAIAHPSQRNYIALTSGSYAGVPGDDPVNLNVAHVADLLESKGLSWKVYAEDYPGNCFTGKKNSHYARKHNPFISYVNVQTNVNRCAHIVNATQFDEDVVRRSLPQYVFYVPNTVHDGHDTTAAYASRWYQQKFYSYLKDPNFMSGTILISTFDEGQSGENNRIYTSIVGPSIKPGANSTALTTYSLLRLIEDNWSLGNLGKNDASAPVVPDSIWKNP